MCLVRSQARRKGGDWLQDGEGREILLRELEEGGGGGGGGGGAEKSQ